jgi:uncharacterized protein (TIGR02231 family)
MLACPLVNEKFSCSVIDGNIFAKFASFQLNIFSMKRIIILLIIACTLQLSAQNSEKRISSKINDVTVYLQGARVSRTATASIPKGISVITFEGLSSDIDPNSVQVGGSGDYVILDITYQINYLRNQPKSREIQQLEDSLRLLANSILQKSEMVKVYREEESMILANKVIGGQQNGLSIAQLREAADFYRTRLADIKTRILGINEETRILGESQSRIQTQLNQYHADRNKPQGEVKITISAPEMAQSKLDLSYNIRNASWMPLYDIRVKDVNNPVNLTMKAQVQQNSNEDWNNVKLSLSTGNLRQSGVIPTLMPWYLSFSPPPTQRPIGYMNQMESKAVRAEAAAPMASDDYGQAKSSYEYTTVSESQTTFEYAISIPYTIPSTGEQRIVEVRNFELPSTYEYYCVPKLDKDAFLKARVTGWGEYNLMAGEINLFFENVYVGKSYLNPRSTQDTLDISLGKDKSIIVTRIMLKEFTQRSVIGLNKKETYAWEISVRNNKRAPITIQIDDQFPVSRVKEIEVDGEEKSGAEFNPETGKLSWRMKLTSGQTEKKRLVFTVKYPKNQTLHIQ